MHITPGTKVIFDPNSPSIFASWKGTVVPPPAGCKPIPNMAFIIWDNLPPGKIKIIPHPIKGKDYGYYLHGSDIKPYPINQLKIINNYKHDHTHKKKHKYFKLTHKIFN